MQIVARLQMKDPSEFLRRRGMDDHGSVQEYIDSECIRLMDPYTPNRNGMLLNAIRLNSDIGSGRLSQPAPYARYQYYGMLMVDPETKKGSFYDPKTGRHWSRPGVSKVMDPGGRKLKHSTLKSPLAGPFWFQRMIKDHGAEIGEGAARLAGGIFLNGRK